MRTQTTHKAIVAVVAAAVLAAAASASARSTSAVACTMLSSSQLKSTLGLSQSTVLRNYDPTGPGSMAVDTECDWGVWSGAPPTSPAATFALARSGNAAQTGIETWAPNKGHERDWSGKGYPELIKELTKGSYAAPTAFAANGCVARAPCRPPRPCRDRPDHEATGLAKGLTVAVGCWSEKKSHKAICVFDEEASSRPVTTHMLTFAKSAVAKFLG